MFSRKPDKKSDSSSDSRRRKGESSSSKAKRTESVLSSNSSRDPDRDDDRSKRTTTRTYSYPPTDDRSEASSYATAPSARQRTGESSKPDKPRRRATDDEYPYEGSSSRRDRGVSDDMREDTSRRSDRSSRGDRTERRESGRSSRRSESDRGLNGSDDYLASRAGETEAFNAQVASPGFTQFPGQSSEAPGGPPSSQQTPASQSGPSRPPAPGRSYTDPTVSNQFPGQNMRPAQSVDEGGPGLAADYYGDQGESVFSQPGVRPEPKPQRQSTDSHLMTPTAAPMPAQDTGHGSAADYYSGGTSPKITPQTGRPPSGTARPSFGPPRPPAGPSGAGAATGAAAVAGGAALGYALGHGTSSQSQASSTYQTAQSTTSTYQQNVTASSSGPRPSSQMPGGFPSPSPGSAISPGQSIPPTPQVSHSGKSSGSNLGAYAAGAAGLAAGAYALHEMHQNHQHTQAASGHKYQYGASPTPPYGRPPSITGMRHRERGPIDKFVDWWKDYEDVAKMEAYTEYIGVCAECFDPGTSARDAPRKHHYHGRRSTENLRERRSRESLRKSGGRVEKRDRYHASSDEEKKGGYAKWVAAGLAGAGLAKAARLVGGRNRDFDDTYSVKSGRFRESRESLVDSKGRPSSRTSHGIVHRRSSDLEGKTVTTERVEERIEKDGKGGYKIIRRRVSRSRSRDRTSAVIGAAAGAAVAGSAIAAHERHKHRSRSRSPRKHRHGSSDKVSVYAESSRHGERRHSRRSDAGSSRVGFAEGLGAAAVAGTFAEAERERRHRTSKRSGGFFGFGNPSTSSIDTSLAYGADTRRHRRRSPGERTSTTKRRSSNEKLNATLLGIGATAAALTAARHGSKVKPVPRHAEVIAVRHGKSRHSRSPRRRRASGASASSASIHSDDEAWEDASESESDSGLAFGNFDYKGKARKSTDSLVSNDSGILSKWGWRWGPKKNKNASRESLGLSYSEAPHMPSAAATTAAIAGAAAVGGMIGKHEGSLRHEESNQSLQSMQLVYPVPTNDPYSFDAMRRTDSASQQPPIYTSRPGSVPLQQPQPIAPINGAVYAQPPTPSYVAPTGPPVFSGSYTAEPEELRDPVKKLSRHESIDVTRRESGRERDSRRLRRASSPVQSHFGRDAAIAGIAAAATAGVIAAEKSREKKETRFELDREQQEREWRRRDEEDVKRRENERKERERREWEAAEAERKVQREREREEAERQDRDRERRHRERREAREAERRADQLERERVAKEAAAKEEAERIERERREEIARDRERRDRERREARETREAERRRQREEREKSVAGTVAAGLAGGAAGAAIAALSDSRKGKEDGKTDRKSRTEERREERRDTRGDDDTMPSARPNVVEVAPPEERQPSIRTVEPTVVEVKPPEPSGVEVDTFEDDFDPNFFRKQREVREREFARRAAAKIVAEYSDADQVIKEFEERYSRSASPSPEEVFAPAGLHDTKTDVERKMDHNADVEIHVFRANEPSYEPPYAFATPIDPSFPAPWPIPRLHLIQPTPEPSIAGSVKGESPPASPEVKPVDAPKDVPEEPLQRTVSVTWGENQTHHYEVPTPEPSVHSLRDSYITDQDIKKHELRHQASDEIIIEEEEEEGMRRKTYRPRSPPSSERTCEREVVKDETETPVDEEVARFFPETVPVTEPEETEEQIYESHSPEVKPIVITPSMDDSRGIYQNPFFETVSDLGLDIDDGKRHGFVEGEVFDQTPAATPTAEKDYSKSMPGAFEEETEDGVTSADAVRRMNEEEAEKMRHASTRDEDPRYYDFAEAEKLSRSDSKSKNKSKRASREPERDFRDIEPTAEAVTAGAAAAALGAAAAEHMRSKDSDTEEKRYSRETEGESEVPSINVFDYLEQEPESGTRPRATREAEKAINAELQRVERRDRDSIYDAAQTALPESVSDLRESSENGYIPLARSFTEPFSTEAVREATADDFEEPSRRKKKKRGSKYDDDIDRTASLASGVSSRSKVSRSRSEDDYDDRWRSKGRSRDDEDYDKRKSKRRSTTDVNDDAEIASSSKSSKSSKGGLFGGLFGKSNDRTETVRERSSKDDDEDRRRKKKSRSKDKGEYSDDDVSRVSSRSDERREKRKSLESRDRHDEDEIDERERSRTDERHVSRYSSQPPEDVVEDVLKSPRDRTYQEERDRDQSFLGMRPEEAVPLAASTAVTAALASATSPSHTSPYAESKPERQRVQFELPKDLPPLPESRPTSPLTVGSAKDLPTLPESRPTSPLEIGSLADLPALPPDRPDSPYEHETPTRLSLQSQRAASTTAIPLRFRRPPPSPAFTRMTSSPIQDMSSPTSTGEDVRSPLSAAWTRHIKTPSTEHRPTPRFSGSEFRPLYLMEKRSSRIMPTFEDEVFPPLPPSRESSRTPSVESQAEEESQAFESAAQSPDASFHESFDRSSPEASFHEARELQPQEQIGEDVGREHEYLGSQQTTPTATTFPAGLMSRPVSEDFETPQAAVKEKPTVVPEIESPVPQGRRRYSRRPSWMGEDGDTLTPFPSVTERFDRLDRLTELPDSRPPSPVLETPVFEEPVSPTIEPRHLPTSILPAASISEPYLRPVEDQSQELLPHMRPTTPAQPEPESTHVGEIMGVAALSGAALVAGNFMASREQEEEEPVAKEPITTGGPVAGEESMAREEQSSVVRPEEEPVQPVEIEEPEEQPALGQSKKAQLDSIAIEPDSESTGRAPRSEIEQQVEHAPALERTETSSNFYQSPYVETVTDLGVHAPAQNRPEEESLAAQPTMSEEMVLPRDEPVTTEAPVEVPTTKREAAVEKPYFQPSSIETSGQREPVEEPTIAPAAPEQAKEEAKGPSMADVLLQRKPSKKDKKKGKKSGKSGKSTPSQSDSGTATPADEIVQEEQEPQNEQAEVIGAASQMVPPIAMETHDTVPSMMVVGLPIPDDKGDDVRAEPVNEEMSDSAFREPEPESRDLDRSLDTQDITKLSTKSKEDLELAEQLVEEPTREPLAEAQPEEEFPSITRKQSKKRKEKKRQKSLAITSDEADSTAKSMETASGLAAVAVAGAAALEVSKEKEEESSASSKKGKGKGKKKRRTVDIWNGEQQEAEQREDEPQPGTEELEQRTLNAEPEILPTEDVVRHEAAPVQDQVAEFQPKEIAVEGHPPETPLAHSISEAERMECEAQRERDEFYDRNAELEREYAEDDLPHKPSSSANTGELPLPIEQLLEDAPLQTITFNAVEEHTEEPERQGEEMEPYVPEEHAPRRPRMPSEVSPRTMPIPDDNDVPEEELIEVPSFPSIAERFEMLDRLTSLPDSPPRSPSRLERRRSSARTYTERDAALATVAGTAALGAALYGATSDPATQEKEADPKLEAIEEYRDAEEVLQEHLHRTSSGPTPEYVALPENEDLGLEEYNEPSINRQHLPPHEQLAELAPSRSRESTAPELVKLPSGEDFDLEYHEPSAIQEHLPPHAHLEGLAPSRSRESTAPELVKLPSGGDLELEEYREPSATIQEHLHPVEPSEPLTLSQSWESTAPEFVKLPSGQDLELEEYHEPSETIKDHLHASEAPRRSVSEDPESMIIEEYESQVPVLADKHTAEDSESMVIEEYRAQDKSTTEDPETAIIEDYQPRTGPVREPDEIEEPQSAPLSRQAIEPVAEDEWAETPSKRGKKGSKKGKKGKQTSSTSRMPVGAISQPKDGPVETPEDQSLEESTTITPAPEPEVANPEDVFQTTGKKSKKGKRSKRSSVVSTPAVETSSPAIQASRDLDDVPITQAEDLVRADEPMPDATEPAEAQPEDEWAISSKKKGKRGSKQAKGISLPSTPPVVEDAREAVAGNEGRSTPAAFAILDDKTKVAEPENLISDAQTKPAELIIAHDSTSVPQEERREIPVELAEPIQPEPLLEEKQEPTISEEPHEDDNQSFTAPAVALAATGTAAAVAEMLKRDKEEDYAMTSEPGEVEGPGASMEPVAPERGAEAESLPDPLLTRKPSKRDKRKAKKSKMENTFDDSAVTEPVVEVPTPQNEDITEEKVVRGDISEPVAVSAEDVPTEANPEEEFAPTTKKGKKDKKKGKKAKGSKSVSRTESPERELPPSEPQAEPTSQEDEREIVEPLSVPLPSAEGEDLEREPTQRSDEPPAKFMMSSRPIEEPVSQPNINLEGSVGAVLADPIFSRPSSRSGALDEPTYDELPLQDSRQPSRRGSRRASRQASFDTTTREQASRVVEPSSRPPPVDDKEFAAVLAAGLSGAGFDPNIVREDKMYSERLPPGQILEDEDQGFSELHRRQTRGSSGKRSRTASPPQEESYGQQITSEPEEVQVPKAMLEAPPNLPAIVSEDASIREPAVAAVEDEWAVPVKKGKKKGKKGSKSSSKAPSGTATPAERPIEMDIDAPETFVLPPRSSTQEEAEEVPREEKLDSEDHHLSEAVLGAAAVSVAGLAAASMASEKRQRHDDVEPAQEEVRRVLTEPTSASRHRALGLIETEQLPVRRSTDIASPASVVPGRKRVSEMFPELERVKRKAPVRQDSISEQPPKRVSLGSGEAAVHRITSPRPSISLQPEEAPSVTKQISAQDLAKPGWSWPDPENRDSAVIMESPQVAQQHDAIRDSGYHDLPITPKTADERPSGRKSRSSSHGSQQSPMKVQIEVSPEWDVSVERGSPTRDNQTRESIDSLDSLPHAIPVAYDHSMPDRPPPSPPAVESTSKDRSSATLFESSPSTREPPAINIASSEPIRPSVEEPAGSPPSIFGPQQTARDGLAPYTPTPASHVRSPSMPLDTIHENSPESPLAKKARPLSVSDVGEPEHVAKAARRSESPETLAEKRRQASLHIVPPESEQRALSPASMVSMGELIDNREWPEVDEERGTVGGIDQVLHEDQSKRTPSSGHPSLGRDSRKVSPIGDHRSPSIVSDKSIGRIKSPDNIRSASVASNRSDRSLRRVDMSGDLRSASRLSGAGVRVSQTPQPPTPIIAGASANERLKGIGRRISMEGVYVRSVCLKLNSDDANDENQEGTGDAPGSPMSPSGRPPSIRKRQSLHIMDLESRLDQLVAENRQLQDAKARYELAMQDSAQDRELHATTIRQATEVVASRDALIQEKDSEIAQIRDMVDRLHQEVDKLAGENAQLTAQNQSIATDAQRFADLQAQSAVAHSRWQESAAALDLLQQQHRELRSKHEVLNSGMEQIVRDEIDARLRDRDDEIQRLRQELDDAHAEIRRLNQEISSGPAVDSFLIVRDDDYIETSCQQLCNHVQQWIMRFSKFSDNRACRLSSEIRDDKIEEMLDDVMLDGSDVDKLLSDRVRRRDVFMSIVISLMWKYIFSRYLFGLDREQRQKLKSLENTLKEVGKCSLLLHYLANRLSVTGPPQAVGQWRAITMTLLSRRDVFIEQRAQDTAAVVHEIFSVLSKLLPPPSHLQQKAIDTLGNVMRFAVDLAIEMRCQRPEYLMMQPLRPEYDQNTGDLIQKVSFNSELMNERSGEFASNEELEERGAEVKIILFPLVMKKGDDFGVGEDETVICPAQVIIAKPNDSKKVVRVMSGAMDIDSRQSMTSVIPPDGTMI